jgi:endoglucanase
VHYYTPYTFCGLDQDADWGKMKPTWGTPDDVKELEELFDLMKGFCTGHDIPAFIGEFGVTNTKESASRVRWMSAVMNASISRKMVPVLWDVGTDLSRRAPYSASDALLKTLQSLAPSVPAAAGK